MNVTNNVGFNTDYIYQHFSEEDYRQFPEYFIAPINLVWELTAECKSNCQYCFGGFHEKMEHELSKEERIALAKEIVAMKVFNITLSGGEPLLCDQLPEIVDILYQGGVNVIICTSGFNMTEELAEKLVRSYKVGFNISMDSFHSEKNDIARGKKGASEAAIHAVNIIRKVGGEQVPISLECVLTKNNLEDINEYIEEARKLGVLGVKFQPMIAIGKGKRVQDVYQELLSGIREDFLHIDFVDQSKHITLGLKTGINWGGIIEPDGRLRPSGYLDIVFDNYKDFGSYQKMWDEGFKQVWNHPFFVSLQGKVNNVKDIEAVSDTHQIHGITLKVEYIKRSEE